MHLSAAGLTMAFALLLVAPDAVAHSPFDSEGQQRLALMLAALALMSAWLLYVRGVRRVKPRPWARAWFHGGMVVAVFAVFGPLDRWAETSTSMHMVQHMAFMVVIAPLWALAAPLPQWRAATPARWAPLWRGITLAGSSPAGAAIAHGAVVWVWHTPALYVLALEDPWWHVVEHASFLFTAWLFWWSVLHAGSRTLGAAMLALGLTLMHTGLLGALLTFSTESFYGAGRSVADQQLAGLYMWVPGSIFYLAGAAWIAWHRLERGLQRADSGTRQASAGDAP